MRGYACACSTNTYKGSTFFVPKLREPLDRIPLLAGLAPYLSETWLREALKIAKAIGEEEVRPFIGKYLSGLRELDCVIMFKAGFETQLRASRLSVSFGMSASGMARQIRDGRHQGGIQPDYVSLLQGLDEVA